MKLIRSLPLNLILLTVNAVTGMEPAHKELAVSSQKKDKKKKSHNQARIFEDSYHETAKLDPSSIHDPKALNMIVAQRHQEVTAQLKIIDTINNTKVNAEYFYQDEPRIRLLHEQFAKYQESIDALTKANAQLIAYHNICLKGNRKYLKRLIAASKESEKNTQEFEKQCRERRLKEEQARERLHEERLKQG